MTDLAKIDPSVLPSLRDLRRATIGMAVLVSVLLITTVLPAERGVDPTGIGALLGLTAIGELKHAAAHGEAAPTHETPAPELASEEPATAEPTATTEPPAPAFRTDEMTLILAPRAGREIKAVMRAGDHAALD